MLTIKGQGRRQKLSPKLPGFGRPARPRNRSETPREDLGKCWPRSASTTAARTKFRGFQHSRGSTEPTNGGRVCQPGLSVANFFANCRKRLTEQIFFPLHWRGYLARGSSARRPMPHSGSRGQASANRLLPVLKGDVSWRGSAWIWRICQITRRVASLCPKQRSQSCARLCRRVRVRLDRTTTL